MAHIRPKWDKFWWQGNLFWLLIFGYEQLFQVKSYTWMQLIYLIRKRILLEWKKIISSFNTSNEIWFSCQPQHHALLTAEFLIPSLNFLLIHLQIKLFITIFDGVTLSHTWFFWKEKHQLSGASINFCCCLQGPHDYPSLTWADSSFRQTDWIFLIVYLS